MSEKLIILDRDGVINQERDDYVREFSHFKIFPGVVRAISRLSKNNYKIAIATNQSALGRKITCIETVNRIHQSLMQKVECAGGRIDHIAICPHHPDENCQCRKPKDGLFIEISKALNLPLKGAYMVGDSERDLIPAIKHGMKPVLVTTGNGARTLEKMQLKDILVIKDLETFVNELLRGKEL